VEAQKERDEQIGRVEWLDISERFQSLGSDVRLDWYQDLKGDQSWNLLGTWDDVRSSEVVCRLAGQMLMKSPRVLKGLSQSIRDEDNAETRWLRFVSEASGGVNKEMQVTQELPDGTQVTAYTGMVRNINALSVRVAIACAAHET
jgi:hypothetical protein